MEASALPLFPDAPPAPPSTAPDLAFTVFGEAEPAGSKKAVPMGRRGGPQRWGVVDANPKAAKWKERVAQVAGEAMGDRPLFRGALEVTFTFYRRRPKGHFGKRGLLPSAPAWPTTRPDASKTVRGCEDAMTGVIWRDDAQVCAQHAYKHWTDGAERVEIEVREL